MNAKKQYLASVQRFLDLTDNIEDKELKEEIRMSFFASIRHLCILSGFDIENLRANGKN